MLRSGLLVGCFFTQRSFNLFYYVKGIKIRHFQEKLCFIKNLLNFTLPWIPHQQHKIYQKSGKRGKKSGKRRKNQKKEENQEEKAKIRKVLSLCLSSRQIGLATLLHTSIFIYPMAQRLFGCRSTFLSPVLEVAWLVSVEGIAFCTILIYTLISTK